MSDDSELDPPAKVSFTQNHKMVRVGRDLKDDLVPIPLP